MRILVVSAWPSPDAPEFGIFVERQVDALRALGHEVRVVPLTETARGRLTVPRKYLSLAWRTRAAIRSFNPTVVHAHYLVPTGLAAWLATRGTGVPLVVTAHGTDVANAARGGRVAAITRRVAEASLVTVAVSEPLAGELERIAPAANVVVCDMGVAVEHTRDGEVSSAPRHWPVSVPPVRPHLLSVGSLVANKNHERLLEALAGAKGGSLVIAGDGPERDRLEARARALGLADRVAFLGRVAPAELPGWWRIADAGVLVSLREGYGLAALECLAAGRPVIVSETAPVAALVREHGCGVLVDPTDSAAIARAIDAAASFPLGEDQARAALAGRDVTTRARETAAAIEHALAQRTSA